MGHSGAASELDAYPHGQSLRVDEDDCRVDVHTNRQNLGTLGSYVDDLHRQHLVSLITVGKHVRLSERS